MGEVLDGACEILSEQDPLHVMLNGVAAAVREHAAAHDGEADEFRHEIADEETVLILLAILWSASANHDDERVRDAAERMLASYEVRRYDASVGRGSAPSSWADTKAA
jgi:hypothetical protein